jgi:hypothetical protein
MSEEILSTAAEDARPADGEQTYVLEAFYGKALVFSERHPFTLQGGERERTKLLPSEQTTTPQGILGLVGRHIEGMHRNQGALFAAMGQMLDRAMNQNAMLVAQQQAILEKQIELTREREALENQKLERELRVGQAELQEARKERFFKQALNLLPVVGLGVQKVLGVKNGSSAAPLRTAIDTFFQSLTDDKRERIMSSLTPDQQVLLLRIWQECMPGEEEKPKKLEEGPNGAS